MRNLMILAKWLARTVNISVEEIRGQTAYISLTDTGRKVIGIPSHWTYTNEPKAADLLEGVLIHEALGHGRFTNLTALKSAVDAGEIELNNVSKAVNNILEDIMIERMAIDTYPGVRAKLAKTVEILFEKNFFGTAKDFAQQPPVGLLISGLLNTLRGTLISGQEKAFEQNSLLLKGVLEETMGQLWTDVLNIAMRVEHSKTSEDNIELTKEIMALIKQASEDQPEESQGKGESGEGDGQSDEGDDTSDSDSQDSSGQAGDKQESSPGKGKPSKDGEPSDGKAEGSSPGSQGDLFDQPTSESDNSSQASDQGSPGTPKSQKDSDNSKAPAPKGFGDKEKSAAQEIMENVDEKDLQSEIGEMISEVLEQIMGGNRPSDISEGRGTQKISDESLRVKSQIKRIADDLRDALETQTVCTKSIKQVGKRLSSRVLPRVRSGNSNVFSQKVIADGVSTAVTVLCDLSGSMTSRTDDRTTTRQDAAVGLMLGLGDILDEYEVPFEFDVYADLYATMKSFSDDWSQVKRKNTLPNVGGGTITGAAMQKALGNLVVQPQDRRLMVIITDGDTGDLQVLASCYAEATEMGIEVASIMIGPMIPSISQLANKFGFKATSINDSRNLGRFAVERILESI
jgi:cobaltochelatase CobT